MKLKALVGAGDRIVALTLPVAVAGIGANVVWPNAFAMGLGRVGLTAGAVLLAVGVPVWIWAVAQILVHVPRGRLITTGPFALVLHPIYTFVALLVIPGVGLIADTWVGFAIGGALYVSSRLFSPREEQELARSFPVEYPGYRARVILPWL
jgi:protein-S-isoprenylcysteine O-methyltransferase Ste14